MYARRWMTTHTSHISRSIPLKARTVHFHNIQGNAEHLEIFSKWFALLGRRPRGKSYMKSIQHKPGKILE
jgi:hypothetical protein